MHNASWNTAMLLMTTATGPCGPSRPFAEVANLPSMWNKAEILKNNPKLAAYRDGAEFIERMR